jgi:hypothetical protein
MRGVLVGALAKCDFPCGDRRQRLPAVSMATYAPLTS